MKLEKQMFVFNGDIRSYPAEMEKFWEKYKNSIDILEEITNSYIKEVEMPEMNNKGILINKKEMVIFIMKIIIFVQYDETKQILN